MGDPLFVTFHPVTDGEALADGWEQPECVPFATLVDDSTLFVHIPSGRVLCLRPGDGEEYWIAPSLSAFRGVLHLITAAEEARGGVHGS